MRQTRLPTRTWLSVLVALSFGYALSCLAEPAFAGNKFQTIGGGISGSSRLKEEHVTLILYIVSGIFLFGSILTIVLPHNNPLFLNFSQWKQSAVIMFIFSLVALVAALLI